jgi:hypothetical protein
MLKQQELALNESLSKVNFENGFSFFTSHGIRGSENVEKIEPYENDIRNFMQVIK